MTQKPEEVEVWWRLEDFEESDIPGLALSPNGVWEPGVPKISLLFRAFRVIKHTPRGVWLDVYGMKRFVLKDSLKRYAYPTKAEAAMSYRKRKERQIKLLKAQLHRAQGGLELLLAPTPIEAIKVRECRTSWEWGLLWEWELP
jgi:hypothetical protein